MKGGKKGMGGKKTLTKTILKILTLLHNSYTMKYAQKDQIILLNEIV